MPYTVHVLAMLGRSDCSYVRKEQGDYSIWWNPSTKQYFQVDHAVVTHFSANDIMRHADLATITNDSIENSDYFLS